MKEIITLDGVQLQVNNVTHSPKTEIQQFNDGTQAIVQPTEMAEVIKELNKDEVEEDTRMSSIDMRARLHPIEASGVLALDSLIGLKVMTPLCIPFSRQKKRLSISTSGMGRQEIVSLVQGKNEQDIAQGGGGFMDKMKGMMGQTK